MMLGQTAATDFFLSVDGSLPNNSSTPSLEIRHLDHLRQP